MGIRERALLFGGRMEVRSKPGEGATLEVILPFKGARQEQGVA